MDLDPNSPAWTVAWAAKRYLRKMVGQKAIERLSYEMLGKAIIDALISNRWTVSKLPPNPPHSTPGHANNPERDR